MYLASNSDKLWPPTVITIRKIFKKTFGKLPKYVKAISVYAKTIFIPQDNLTAISQIVTGKPQISTSRRKVSPDIDLQQTRFRIDCNLSCELVSFMT